jgi:hypothetical protein
VTLAEFYSKLRQALMSRRHHYQAVFRAPSAKVVLTDLARFCRAHESTAHENTHLAARLDGRREVWLRIAHHLHLAPDQLWELYSGRNSSKEEENDA